MDTASIITLAGIVLANIGTTIGLFLWSTSNANEFRKEAQTLLNAIQAEMKDFHGRLCSIEERTKTKI